ncbi:hypothetical protein B0I35DRAFT_55285 [Stachybotrys elegans]|uniref:Uncharacterized protein n=1 Tax=Stachybotrys elegans TaxID=80388 RepID=A0A8K0WPN8_9HYPO|nr:hypothetical protein B0I35DRAFT_55285 [Stachybotrys elegans]
MHRTCLDTILLERFYISTNPPTWQHTTIPVAGGVNAFVPGRRIYETDPFCHAGAHGGALSSGRGQSSPIALCRPLSSLLVLGQAAAKWRNANPRPGSAWDECHHTIGISAYASAWESDPPSSNATQRKGKSSPRGPFPHHRGCHGSFPLPLRMRMCMCMCMCTIHTRRISVVKISICLVQFLPSDDECCASGATSGLACVSASRSKQQVTERNMVDVRGPTSGPSTGSVRK